MNFVKDITYSRDDIYRLYYGKPLKPQSGGNWHSGYVKVKNELLVFMNIGTPGRTGHNFPNSYDHEIQIAEWFSKPGMRSQTGICHELVSRQIRPHFFARWDNKDPHFTYLGEGTVIDYADGHPTTYSNGRPTVCVKFTVAFEN